MNRSNRLPAFVGSVVATALCLVSARTTGAQVNPGDIRNPKLSAIEAQYLPQLRSLQLAIGETRFPLPFVLTRYVGVDPSRQASLDTRGLEFVYFQNRVVLKTSGFYAAAYSAEELTPNQRANRTFDEVVMPILQVIAQQMPADMTCDDIGFEIAYHTRAGHKNSDFEGREILAVVMNRADAFALAGKPQGNGQQAILNRSQVFLDAKPLGLALGKREPLDLEALGKPEAEPTAPTGLPAPVVSPASLNRRLQPASVPNGAFSGVAGRGTSSSVRENVAADKVTAATPDDAERLQKQYQERLDAFVRDGGQFHLVDYAPPTVVADHKRLALQLTLRNPAVFEGNGSSIYKRAAQSFDLFLAVQLKAMMAQLPADLPVDAMDFSILNRLNNAKDSSESVDFICPLKAIRSFAEDEITSQDLIDQSMVLVNGARITLHLEVVE